MQEFFDFKLFIRIKWLKCIYSRKRVEYFFFYLITFLIWSGELVNGNSMVKERMKEINRAATINQHHPKSIIHQVQNHHNDGYGCQSDAQRNHREKVEETCCGYYPFHSNLPATLSLPSLLKY